MTDKQELLEIIDGVIVGAAYCAAFLGLMFAATYLIYWV